MNDELYQLNDVNGNLVSVYPVKMDALNSMRDDDTLTTFERVTPKFKKIDLSCAVNINMDFFFYNKNKAFGTVGSLTKIISEQEYKYIHNDKGSYTHCEFRTNYIYSTLNNFALPKGLLINLHLKNGDCFKTEEYSFKNGECFKTEEYSIAKEKNDIFNWVCNSDSNDSTVIGFEILGLARGYVY